MPFIPNTPESLIQRSDSRDPAATCRGLTSTGRPCRRPVTGSPRSSKPSNSPLPTTGEPAYCWQHKDQAATATSQTAFPQGLQKTKIKERSSIDTLVDRLGLLEVESPTKTGAQRRRPHTASPAVHSSGTYTSPQNAQYSEKPSHASKPKPESINPCDLLCCFGVADEEPPPARPSNKRPAKTTSSLPTRLSVHNTQSDNAKLSPNPVGRPKVGRDQSRTAEFLSLIPSDVSPETSALLLAELAKPISALDEPGFIYIFWLTSESLPNAPPTRTASSLLAPPTDPSRPAAGRRRTSDVLQSFTTPNSSPNQKKSILLKIGRANNVQRRMNEWQRQCGYNVTLIRFYPYIDVNSPSPSPSSSPKASPRPSLSQANTPRKVPNVHKVERLIHLELAGRGKKADMGGKCGRCGTLHREWFEVEGSRKGIEEIDHLIRRWVAWAERGGDA